MVQASVRDRAKSPTQGALEATVKRVTELSTLPHVAAQVIEVSQDANSGATDMCRVVESDPSLSARVLRCVNSAAYGLRTRLGSLQRAVAYLGFKQVRNLALTATVADVFSKEERTQGVYDRRRLWRHMVGSGIAARFVAARSRLPEFEDAFLGGLLHDLGIILEDQYAHPSFISLCNHLDTARTLCENEQQHLGFDHTQIGHTIGERWRFSPSLLVCIRYHHRAQDYHGEHEKLLAAVDVANLLITGRGTPSFGVNLLRPGRASLDRLKLTRADLTVLGEDLGKELTNHRELFRLLDG